MQGCRKKNSDYGEIAYISTCGNPSTELLLVTKGCKDSVEYHGRLTSAIREGEGDIVMRNACSQGCNS